MIKIFKNGIELKHSTMLFPAGDVGVKLDAANYKYLYNKSEVQTIIAKLHNSNDVMELFLVHDALKRLDSTPINLFIPYFNYAQQDRVCVKGEAFSAQVFANLLNSLNFNQVTVVDPHSGVLEAMIKNVKVINQFDVVNIYRTFVTRVMKGAIFVAPDAGSNKKTSELAKYFSHKEFVRADKLRDLNTGKILETIVYKDDFGGVDIVIADDICVGGATFIELAKVLKKKNCGKIILFVTHGIFSKGTKSLFEGGIDEIYTTNSYFEVLPVGLDRLNILNLEEEFLLNEITPKIDHSVNVAFKL